ncbi:MAG: triose-phosphate isomerase, partial [Patescibacteria group bacterium]
MFDLIPLIKAVGYLGIFGIVFAESGFFIGFFLPGDSLLFTAGFLASQGFLNIWNLVFVIFIGAVIGDNFGYAFGKKVGPMIFKKEDSFLFHKDNLNKAKMFYEKYGGKAVILARFMPGIRTFAPILAGVGKMKYSKFLAFNIIGGALWGMGLPLLGYYLGNVIPNIDRYIVFIVLLIILISVSPMIWHVLKDRNTRERILNILYKKTKYTNKLVVFNWKMNPETLEGAIDIAKKSDHKNIVIAPPFVFIEEVGKIIKKAELGAQDLFYKDIKSGSFTGEISASELANLGVKYVIIGHSERRAMGESDEIISKKIK